MAVINVGETTSPLAQALGILGGVGQGFTALQQEQAKHDLEALQLLARNPEYELAPVPQAQASPLLERLLSGQRYQPLPSGAPVVSVGGQPMSVQKRQPLDLSTLLQQGGSGTTTATTGGGAITQAAWPTVGDEPVNPGLPQTRTAIPQTVTREELLAHESVQAPYALYQAMPTRENQAKVFAAIAGARKAILAERQQQYTDALSNYRATREARKPAYGYGNDVDAALDELFGEQLRRSGQPPSPPMLARANALVQQRKVEQQAAQGTGVIPAKTKAEQEAKRTLTLQERWQEHSPTFVDTQTGQPIDPTHLYGDVEQMQRTGAVRKLTNKQAEQLEHIQTTVPILVEMNRHLQAVYGPGGVLADTTPQGWNRLKTLIATQGQQFFQDHPELVAAQKFFAANGEALARALRGLQGAGSEGDVQRAMEGLANIKTGLTVAVQWPPKIALDMPDTRGVALRVQDDLNRMVNAQAGLLVGNKNFQFPELAEIARPELGLQARPGGAQASAEVAHLRTLPPGRIKDLSDSFVARLPADVPGLRPDQQAALDQRRSRYTADTQMPSGDGSALPQTITKLQLNQLVAAEPELAKQQGRAPMPRSQIVQRLRQRGVQIVD
jgi:hypothetical protein